MRIVIEQAIIAKPFIFVVQLIAFSAACQFNSQFFEERERFLRV